MFNVSTLLLDDALLKCVVTEVVLFSIVAFKTLTFHKVVYRHNWGMVGSLVTFSWFWRTKACVSCLGQWFRDAGSAHSVHGSNLCVRPVALELSTRQLERSGSLAETTLDILLKTHLFTLYCSILAYWICFRTIRYELTYLLFTLYAWFAVIVVLLQHFLNLYVFLTIWGRLDDDDVDETLWNMASSEQSLCKWENV